MFILLIFTAGFASLAYLAYTKIRLKKGMITFIYRWAFPVGAWVWEDLFIISFYGMIASLTTYFTKQIRLGLLFFLLFWIVRSAGESLYFFLQQFIRPRHHPHKLEAYHFRLFRKIFGQLDNQQYYIFMQLFHQSILMLSLLGLILVLLNWSALP